jgi:hypothetical protein
VASTKVLTTYHPTAFNNFNLLALEKDHAKPLRGKKKKGECKSTWTE